ncbi:unnamed protein product [Sphagnum jensenii]|uniref:Uncharacterized protein n=1 Tax=Sphagnum jensenii TaxID=128206 RepID=A0ABP0V5Y2_9BRYO
MARMRSPHRRLWQRWLSVSCSSPWCCLPALHNSSLHQCPGGGNSDDGFLLTIADTGACIGKDADANEHIGEEFDEAHAGYFARLSHRFNAWRDRGFDRFTNSYGRLLNVLLTYRKTALGIAALAFAVTMFLIPVIGTDFFPTTDSGMMKLHFRAPLEETEKLVDRAETRIKKIIPAKELETINDMIGLPTSYNLAFINTDNASGMDAEILISLKEGHQPTVGYMKKIRKDLNDNFPGCTIYFQSADIVSQVLNFGLSAPIDIQIQNNDYYQSYTFARKLRDDIKGIPGVEDVAIKQVLDYPALNVNVDRVRAARLGLTQRDVANNLLITLSSSSTVSPSFFLNPINSVNYAVAVQVPYQKISSMQEAIVNAGYLWLFAIYQQPYCRAN